MKYSIRKNWISSFDFIKTNTIVILPFMFIAFFETLALELIYFSTRKPLSLFVNPIIMKFLGENFVHYPGNLLFLPQAFYYAQILIYIFISIFMTAISVNIFKNAKAKLPIKADALIKNAFKNYISYIIYAIIVIFLIILLKRADTFIFTKLTQAFFKNLPNVASKFYFIGVSLSLFFANVILEVFLVLTIPAMVIQKKPLFKALWASLYLGFRNFFSIFGLIFLPFLAYLPVTLLKSMSMPLADKMFPEINLYITVMGIIIALFIDCYIILCASQFLLDRETKK